MVFLEKIPEKTSPHRSGSELQRWGGDGTGGTGGGPVGGGMGRPLSFGGGKNAIFFRWKSGTILRPRSGFSDEKSEETLFVGNLYFEELLCDEEVKEIEF